MALVDVRLGRRHAMMGTFYSSCFTIITVIRYEKLIEFKLIKSIVVQRHLVPITSQT